MKIDTVIVLAGDRGPDNPVAAAAGVKRKALALINGKPMLYYPVDAILKSGRFRKILILANRVHDIQVGLKGYEFEPSAEIIYVEGQGSPVKTVASVLDKGIAKTPVLVVTGDHPLLTTRLIDDFLDSVAAIGDCDVVVGLVPAGIFRQKFPGMKRTFIRLGRESWCGANMFALLNDNVRSAVEFWMSVEQDRKKSLRMVRAFGWVSLIRVLLRLINLESAMKRASIALRAETRAVPILDANAAMDVDRPEHLDAASKVLSEQGR